MTAELRPCSSGLYVLDTKVPSSLQAGDKSALQQAESWVQSASAWAARLLAAFPLYLDLLQPVVLAVSEMRAGLAALASAQRSLQTGRQDEQLGAVVAQLGTFPARPWDEGAQDCPPTSLLQSGACDLPEP